MPKSSQSLNKKMIEPFESQAFSKIYISSFGTHPLRELVQG